MKKKIIYFVVFCIYLILLIYFLIFAEQMDRTLAERSYRYNLVAFKEIRRFLSNVDTLGLKTVVLNLGGNIIGFMPLGFLLPAISKRLDNVFLMIALSFDFSLGIEFIQLVGRVGCFDVDDLILNTLGGLLGYIVYIIYSTLGRQKKNKSVNI